MTHAIGMDTLEAHRRFDAASVERLLANARDGLAALDENAGFDEHLVKPVAVEALLRSFARS